MLRILASTIRKLLEACSPQYPYTFIPTLCTGYLGKTKDKDALWNRSRNLFSTRYSGCLFFRAGAFKLFAVGHSSETHSYPRNQLHTPNMPPRVQPRPLGSHIECGAGVLGIRFYIYLLIAAQRALGA